MLLNFSYCVIKCSAVQLESRMLWYLRNFVPKRPWVSPVRGATCSWWFFDFILHGREYDLKDFCLKPIQWRLENFDWKLNSSNRQNCYVVNKDGFWGNDKRLACESNCFCLFFRNSQFLSQNFSFKIFETLNNFVQIILMDFKATQIADESFTWTKFIFSV